MVPQRSGHVAVRAGRSAVPDSRRAPKKHWKKPMKASIAACLVALFLVPLHLQAQAPGRSILPVLEQRLGLSETQVRGALGALLVYARERLPKPEFDDLAETIPNADRIMQDVKLSGVVTGPLDDMDDYEAALSHLGIGQPLAASFVPAVLQSLGETGHTRERDILARVIG
jgi:hypothetical protein